ncbi:hypothetical protein DID88_006746 [Monilinia fructigena]|uniref:Uncharacterized protein n=1 Tax=Monilinia fructigena TaxID=38457 RepID=A0A395IFV5_9HELO|nr:hypothetical protein DID88_006746 [Monilinia fructigena]
MSADSIQRISFLQSLGISYPLMANPEKRRGPKPDSKPASTRRQELNRQAQSGRAQGGYNANGRSMAQQQAHGVDYDQAGIDFVLTLERPSIWQLTGSEQKVRFEWGDYAGYGMGYGFGHPRFSELKEVDFKSMSEELLPKVRCYGFGAALEEFEVRDALEARFGMEPNYLS